MPGSKSGLSSPRGGSDQSGADRDAAAALRGARPPRRSRGGQRRVRRSRIRWMILARKARPAKPVHVQRLGATRAQARGHSLLVPLLVIAAGQPHHWQPCRQQGGEPVGDDQHVPRDSPGQPAFDPSQPKELPPRRGALPAHLPVGGRGPVQDGHAAVGGPLHDFRSPCDLHHSRAAIAVGPHRHDARAQQQADENQEIEDESVHVRVGLNGFGLSGRGKRRRPSSKDHSPAEPMDRPAAAVSPAASCPGGGAAPQGESVEDRSRQPGVR
jgi:hypothetical protein